MKKFLEVVSIFACGLLLFACNGDLGSSNSGPIADAGVDQTVRSGQKVLLSSTNSDDPDGVILNHTWAQVSNGAPDVELFDTLRFPADPSISTPVVSFFVPELYTDTPFVFQVTVTDDGGKTSSDTVTVTAKPPIDSNQLLTFYRDVPRTFKVLADTDDPSGSYEIIVTPKITYTNAIGETQPLTFDLQGGLAQQTSGTQAWSSDPFPDPPPDPATEPGPSPGRDLYDSSVYPGGCNICHSLGSYDTTGSEANLSGKGSQISLGDFPATHPLSPITGLTQVQLDELAAFVDTIAPSAYIIDGLTYLNPPITFKIPVLRVEDINSVVNSEFASMRYRREDPNEVGEFRIDKRLDESHIDDADINVEITAQGSGPITLYVLNPEGTEVLASSQPGGSITLTLEELQVQDSLASSPTSVVAENRSTAAAYYDAITCGNEKLTFGDWLTAVDYYGANNTVTETSYINGFDLGFGRKMSVSVNESTGEVFSYVNNHANLELADLNVNPLVNVVMEFSPPPCEDPQPNDGSGICTNCYTKFFTYVRDRNDPDGKQKRVLSFDFDGRGEKFQPGSCTVCHGGKPNAQYNAATGWTYPDGVNGPGDIGSRFMPWDQATLFFSDEDFLAKTHTVDPTPEQVAAIKKFNEAILGTLTNDPSEAATAMREVINGWYGTPSIPFNADFVPIGWAGNEDLYRKVIGPTCRACHNQREDTSVVKTFAQFSQSESTIARTVYDESTMPLARLTVDNFWTDGQGRADLLAAALNVNTQERIPGTPKSIAEIFYYSGGNYDSGSATLDGLPLNGFARLNGTKSLFANAESIPYAWTCLDQANSDCSSMIIGQNSAEPIFHANATGTYSINLTVRNFIGMENTSSLTIVVP
jgi:K319L-like, PKD domain